MDTYSFSSAVERSISDKSWFVIVIPADVAQAWFDAGQGRVSGAIAGQPFRGPIRSRCDGRFYLVVNKAIRQTAGLAVGDTVQVTLEVGAGESETPLPADLAAVLNGNPVAGAAFARMAPSHRREFVAWLDETKNPDTRQRRLARVLEMLAAWKSPATAARGDTRGQGGRR